MTDERELDDGLAAFDQLGREMAETNRLLRAVRSDQAARNQQEHALSAEMRTALKQATGASQKALQASQTEIRSSDVPGTKQNRPGASAARERRRPPKASGWA